MFKDRNIFSQFRRWKNVNNIKISFVIFKWHRFQLKQKINVIDRHACFYILYKWEKSVKWGKIKRLSFSKRWSLTLVEINSINPYISSILTFSSLPIVQCWLAYPSLFYNWQIFCETNAVTISSHYLIKYPENIYCILPNFNIIKLIIK